ncbi:MAG: type II toxin-antitoxin system PemK/MazF family toxin [Candidatus Hodarchaeota archaeon]
MERWRRFQIRIREIWDVELSYPGEGVGHEEQFRHPCIVIKFNKFVDMATIIPLSSKIQALKDFPHTYIINPDNSNGLTNQSIALIYQIRSLSKQRFIRNRGRLSKADHDRIQILIKDYFQIS